MGQLPGWLYTYYRRHVERKQAVLEHSLSNQEKYFSLTLFLTCCFFVHLLYLHACQKTQKGILCISKTQSKQLTTSTVCAACFHSSGAPGHKLVTYLTGSAPSLYWRLSASKRLVSLFVLTHPHATSARENTQGRAVRQHTLNEQTTRTQVAIHEVKDDCVLWQWSLSPRSSY